MQFICVVTASHNLGFLLTKNPWLVFRLKHIFFETKFFVSLSMEKLLVIQTHIMDKMLIIHFYIMKKNAYFANFIHLCLLDEMYERV